MTIEMHIERLILDGIDIRHRDRLLLQTAVETELARLLAEGSFNPQTNITLQDIPAGQIQLSHDNDPTQLGRQIARSVYGGINQ